MKLYRLAIVWMLFSTVIDVNHSYAGDRSTFKPELSLALQSALEQARGTMTKDNVSASLFISDQCYWEGVAGATNQDPNVPVRPDSIYGFGSITKTLVAAITLQLAEEGMLTLDDTLGSLLPNLPGIDGNISVRQLLNHGSGLGDYYGGNRYWNRVLEKPDRVWQPEETLQFERAPTNSARYN